MTLDQLVSIVHRVENLKLIEVHLLDKMQLNTPVLIVNSQVLTNKLSSNCIKIFSTNKEV